VAVWVLAIVAVSASFIAYMVAGVQSPSLFAVLPAVLIAYATVLIAVQSIVGTKLPPAAALFGYSLLLLTQIMVLFISGARGAWIAFFASLPVFGVLAALRLRRFSLAGGILAVTLVGGVLLLLLNISGGPLQSLRTVHGISRLANITDAGGAGGSAQGRLLIWQGVKTLVTNQPAIGNQMGGAIRLIVGYGPETLHWAFQAVYPLKLRQVTSEIWAWDRAHNIYLDALVDAGILGLLAFVITVTVFFWQSLRALMRAGDDACWILIACVAAVAAHLVDGIFGLDMPATLILFWTAIALVVAVLRDSPDPEVVETEPIDFRMQSVLATGAGLVVLLVLAAVSGTEKPAFIASLWLISALYGVAAIAYFLHPLDRLRMPNISSSTKRLWPVLLLTTLCVALAAAAQLRFEAAAFAERDGLTALSQSQLPQAVGFLQEAARMDTEEPQYRTELGGAFLSLGANHFDSADPMYQATAPDAETIDPLRAQNFGRDQLFTLALYALQSAHSLSPLDPDTLSNLGNLYLAWNKPQLALPEYRQAEALSSRNPRYLDQEALTMLQAGQTRLAAQTARQALQLDTTFWYSYYAASLVDQKLGAHQRAREEAQTSLGWVHNYWPPPPTSQLDQMRSIVQTG